jgi:predicted nucleic acid-binding protein
LVRGRSGARASRGNGTGDGSLARLILDTTVLVDAERGGESLAEAIDDDDVAIAAIAATARARDREVVSADQSGFADLPDGSVSGGDG